jgi:RNA recognition motif-containing protein
MSDKNVYISNIPEEYSKEYVEEQLKKYFPNNIVNIKKKRNSNYGFVEFKDLTSKEECLNKGYIVCTSIFYFFNTLVD